MQKRHQPGFTIVELLIVIVIIGILAAITIIAYNGVQTRARDSVRQQDVSQIVQALELYYLYNGKYPSGSGSTVINSGWSTTADASWANLETALKPYVSTIPRDPTSTLGANVLSGTGYNYAYFGSYNGNYCGTGPSQMFILVYRLENSAQSNTLVGDCTTSPLGPYAGASNYRVNKI